MIMKKNVNIMNFYNKINNKNYNKNYKNYNKNKIWLIFLINVVY